MASGVITVGTWRDDDTSMGAVLATLDRLRQSDRRGAVRTSFLTLLAVGGRQIEVDDTFDTVQRLGHLQPTRVVVIRVTGRERHRLDARVGVHLQERGQRCLGIDDVALEVAGPVTDHLDSLIEPLTQPDLPVVMWCRERLPPARSRLIDLADHLVVDSARAGGRERLAALDRLRARVPVSDFTWLRLLPLRRRLAGTLSRAELRPLLDEVRTASVAGPDLERALLAAWVGTSLPGAVVAELDEGEDTSSWSVSLEGDGWRIRAAQEASCIPVVVERDGREPWTTTATAAPPTSEGLLAQVLVHLRPDPVYGRTLAAAAAGRP